MKKIATLFFISCLLIFLSCNNHTKQPYWPKETNLAGEVDSTLSVSLNESKFLINRKTGQIIETKDGKTKSEYLLQPALDDDIVLQAFAAYYKDELLIYYTPGNIESSHEAYLNVFDKNSKNPLFTAEIGLLSGLPLVKDSFTYVNSSEFMGKINLNNGQYVWKYNLNIGNGSWSSPDSIIIKNNNIIFLTTYKDKELDSVVIDDISGNTIKGVKNGTSTSVATNDARLKALPMSKYFEVLEPKSGEYQEGGNLQLDLSVRNNSKYDLTPVGSKRFSNFLGAEVHYKWKETTIDGTGTHVDTETCTSTVQSGEISCSDTGTEWKPGEVLHFHIQHIPNGAGSNCSAIKFYEQNMKDIYMDLEVYAESNSDNLKMNGYFDAFGLNSLYKAKQSGQNK